MGILDDAIREHLELKRRHGAPGDDVERLEKEAFGPPTRPGDPDFEGEDGEAQSPDSGELTAAEQARIEHAELGDTVDHPALEIPETGEEPFAEPPASGEPSEAPEAAIFFDREGERDGGDEEEVEEDEVEEDLGDLDLDLELGDDAPPPVVTTAEQTDEHALGAVEEVEAEDELAVDFELDDLGDDPLELPAAEPEPTAESDVVPAAPPETGETEAAPAQGFEGDDAEEDQLEDEDEDLLEETPDFLQDTPEGERLWFEQDEPKDFDFDD